MPRHVVLLRGINLGGKRTMAMADLRAALEAAGHEDVRTLLQSGNVVLTAPNAGPRLERDLAGTLRDAFGLDVGVVVRTLDELAEVVARDPLAGVATDPSRHLVTFLGEGPDPARVAELEAAAVAPERVAVHGREVYSWHPGGIGRSPLAALITSPRLGVEATARNWRTVTRLLELAREARA